MTRLQVKKSKMNFVLKIFLIFPFAVSLLQPKSIDYTALLIPSDLRENNSASYQKIVDDLTSIELFLIQHKIIYNVIYTDKLDEIEVDNYSLIILPSSFDFSEEEFELLKSAIVKGVGLLSFGNLFVRIDEQKSDFYEKLFEDSLIERFENHETTLTQSFQSNESIFPPFENFDLLIKSNPQISYYKTDKEKFYSFGCLNGEKTFTTSFLSFVGSGRIAHFGFSFNKVLSDKSQLNKFNKLILKVIDWLKKDAGIWITESTEFKKQFLISLDLDKTGFINENILNRIFGLNYPILLITAEPNKLKKYHDSFGDEVYYGLKLNCESNVDSIVQTLSNSEKKINFLLSEKKCLNEREIKRFSFAGVNTILIRNDERSYYNQFYDILVTSFNDYSSIQCSEENIYLLDVFNKISCESDNLNETLYILEKQSDLSKSFNRKLLINHLLLRTVNITSSERENDFEIIIQNPNKSEINDLMLIVDKKFLNQKLIYDLRIDGQSSFIEKCKAFDNLKIELSKIRANSKIVIEFFFNDHI
ncbi:hypothetical protein [Ignavibacterium sp.]|uniref:hypothetical protein n=1 Tax=Ignavibacterium sp. TaxID=2651167 RepID=UPI00307FAE03